MADRGWAMNAVPQPLVSFALTFPDGTLHTCTGRIEPRRSRAKGRSGVGAPDMWQIAVVSGPNMWHAFRDQTEPLEVRLEDGRTGRVVIANDVTLHVVGALSTNDRA